MKILGRSEKKKKMINAFFPLVAFCIYDVCYAALTTVYA